MAEYIEKQAIRDKLYAAVCSECGASSGSQLSEEEAAAAWNRRAGENEQT